MKKILDWNEYSAKAREAIAEGCVLLENKNNVLPLPEKCRVSVFGRIQSNYYKSGTGSGGKVNVAKVYGLVDGLEESGKVVVNKDLQKIYADWEKENPYDEGLGWGQERWSQDEMPLTEKIVNDAAAASDVAIVIIGRTAGEDKDNSNTEGSYLLTKAEEDMLAAVRKGFSKVVVLLNVGNIIDMSFVEKYTPDSVMYVWQGGMLGGLGTADVLTGLVSPSGKLTDTIAKNISDYPSDKYFGKREGNNYVEDIFVGYRYFESFAKDKVMYPFGYGLSYSTFEAKAIKSANDEKAQNFTASIEVANTGKVSGKEVVQLYVEAPQGHLGKPSRVLVDFAKTTTLPAGGKETINFTVPYECFASYDDNGASGNKSCFVLEAGEYKVFAGTDVRSAVQVLSFNLPETKIIHKCEEALAPVTPFDRMHADEKGNLVMERAPIATVSVTERRLQRLPKEIKQTENKNIKLKDVLKGTAKMEDFIAQMTDEDLACMIRGEGMGSSLVTPGTASAYGGVSPRLRDVFGIPAVCCDDGPSGMRLDCGIKAFALPNGTLLASTFNCQLVTDLYNFTGYEMITNNVENLLGPGMNIHRHPLNGRNFEYFSEDPLITGKMGTAMIKGLRSAGVTGTVKHFCGNNQEAARHFQDSVISERALREIYLKGFEMAVRSGYADSVMTTYGMVNGVYTSGCYDLNTTILREDWGFKGIVMTDWWANISEPGVDPDKTNFAAIVKSQNDLYMCCPDGSKNASGDNTIQALNDGRITRGELQRNAINVCTQVMGTEAMKRFINEKTEVEIINRPANPDDINLDDVEQIVLAEDGLTIDLSGKEVKMNDNIIYAIDVTKPGKYEMTLTASSELNEVAQLPCTFFTMGIPIASFTFTGSGGKDVSISKEVLFWSRFQVTRLFVGCNGLKISSMKFKYLDATTDAPMVE